MHTNQQIEAVIWKRGKQQNLEFLLAKRTPERGGFWQPLTGGVELGEDLEIAVARELNEEFGITNPVSVQALDFRFRYMMPDGKHIHEEVYSVEVPTDQPITLSAEHTEFRWCSVAESDELLLWEDNREAIHRVSIAQQTHKTFVRIPAVAILVTFQGKFLIIQRSADDHHPNIWEIPGGSIDPEENLETAALRELKEETGLTKVSVGEIINTNAYLVEYAHEIKEIAHTTVHAKLLTGQQINLSNEHQAYAWISQTEFFNYDFSRHTRESLMKYFNITK